MLIHRLNRIHSTVFRNYFEHVGKKHTENISYS